MRISDWSSDVCSSDLFEVEEFLLEKAVVDHARIVERHREAGVAGRRNRLSADAAERDVIAGEVRLAERKVRRREHIVVAALDIMLGPILLRDHRTGQPHARHSYNPRLSGNTRI